MSIRIVPRFNVNKQIFQDLQWDSLRKDFSTIINKQNFLSFFSKFTERKMTTVWVGRSYQPGSQPPAEVESYHGAPKIKEERTHPVGPEQDSSVCVTVGNGPWKEKIYHFLPDRPPSSGGQEIQTEYFIKVSKFLDAIEALYKIRDQFTHLLQISEMRMCAADNLPMSPGNEGEAVIGIHFTWFRRHDEIVKVLPIIERQLQPFDPKPHPGKIFEMSGPKFEEMFGRLKSQGGPSDIDYLRYLMVQHDPQGKFRNEYLDAYFFTTSQGRLSNKQVKHNFYSALGS
mmetsp:Transcript_9651/g.16211  ORF Transcript_9651/g.16211 Transcript_9651/m.16211 type:complete len:285 (-) Transcript_9651:114-968(-)